RSLHALQFSSAAFATHRPLHSSPTRRSSDLLVDTNFRHTITPTFLYSPRERALRTASASPASIIATTARSERPIAAPSSCLLAQDRKSTRLNSSHVKISYAVFCLKKKTHPTR